MSSNRYKIMIVDDVIENIDVLVNVLENEYEIIAATGAYTALEIVRSGNTPDLILLDVMMPEMDGYEMLGHLKRDPKTSEIPVIFVTAMGDEHDEVRGFTLGASDYIVKPINAAITTARIKTHLELYAHRKTLELLVEKKSKELVDINRDLKQMVFVQTEENLAKSKIIQEQSRFAQMGELIKMIAHQWRQPLNTIATSLQLLPIFDDLSSESLEESKIYIDRAMKEVYYLSNIITSFSKFFKPSERPQEVCLCLLINDAISLLAGVSTEHKITIKNSCAEGYDKAMIYPSALGDVIMSLLQNSVEAFVKNSIQDPWIEIHVHSEDEHTLIEISDNGGGIDEAILDKIYDPYFSTKTQLQKYGLGLYASKTVIETHFLGRLEVKNINNGVLAAIMLPKRVAARMSEGHEDVV